MCSLRTSRAAAFSKGKAWGLFDEGSEIFGLAASEVFQVSYVWERARTTAAIVASSEELHA